MATQENKKMVPLKDLNLSSRFLFDEVMEDAQTNQDVLSIILGREIPLICMTESEKEQRISPLARSVRLDVFSMDEDDNVYSAEMQNERKTDLAKRSRYYQSLIDSNLLEAGIPNYNILNNTYLIMIMTFDLFGLGKYQYTFEPRCREDMNCKLEDGTVRIFLNTRGENDDEVSQELIDFLHYIENSTKEVADRSGSERIRRLHNRVCKVKLSEEVGVRYMLAWEEKYFEREEAREEGLKEGIKEGREDMLKQIIKKKFTQGQSSQKIAEDLMMEEAVVEQVIQKLHSEEK